jgi:hypothetical protein
MKAEITWVWLLATTWIILVIRAGLPSYVEVPINLAIIAGQWWLDQALLAEQRMQEARKIEAAMHRQWERLTADPWLS